MVKNHHLHAFRRTTLGAKHKDSKPSGLFLQCRSRAQTVSLDVRTRCGLSTPNLSANSLNGTCC